MRGKTWRSGASSVRCRAARSNGANGLKWHGHPARDVLKHGQDAHATSGTDEIVSRFPLAVLERDLRSELLTQVLQLRPLTTAQAIGRFFFEQNRRCKPRLQLFARNSPSSTTALHAPSLFHLLCVPCHRRTSCGRIARAAARCAHSLRFPRRRGRETTPARELLRLISRREKSEGVDAPHDHAAASRRLAE